MAGCGGLGPGLETAHGPEPKVDPDGGTGGRGGGIGGHREEAAVGQKKAENMKITVADIYESCNIQKTKLSK